MASCNEYNDRCSVNFCLFFRTLYVAALCTMSELGEAPGDGAGFRARCNALQLTFQSGLLLPDLQGLPVFGNVTEYSFGQERVGHLHTHVFLVFSSRIRVTPALFEVGGARPHISISSCRGRNQRRSLDRGHFYCVCPYKVGHISAQSNYNPGVDYVVALEWIRCLWQQGKLRDPVACATVYRCLTPSFETQCNRIASQQAILSRATFRSCRRRILQDARLPARAIPEIIAWKDSFSDICFRYKFLWLYGPTQMGKTIYAASLFNDPFLHSSGIAWSGYDAVRHDGIIFDDCVGIELYVIEHKLLFQSSAICTLQTSRTNCHSILIDTEEKPIVVVSNHPPRDLWILANAVLYEALEGLFVEAQALADA